MAALAIALCGLAVFASLASLVRDSLDRAGEAEAGAWLGHWTWVPLVLVPLAFLPVSFLHGRLLSPRWRVVPWCAGIGTVGFAFSQAFAAGPLHEDPEVVNPYGIEHVHPLRSRLQRRVNQFMYGSSDNGHAPAGGLREWLHEAFVPEAVEPQGARERLVAAREEERRRLRRDLHDGLGPALAGAALKLEAAENLLASRPGEAAELLDHARAEIQAAVGDVRRLRDLPAAIEVAAYRISVEAMTNAARHARA